MIHGIDSPSFLIASPDLFDPHFYRAVILLLDRNEQGAFGFVINHLSTFSLDEIILDEKFAVPKNIPVFSAGPMSHMSGYVVHTDKTLPCEKRISDDISVSASQETLIKILVAQNDPWPSPFRLFVGYSGWGPGQLEEEIKQGAWLVAPFKREILFNVPYQKIWQTTLETVGIKNISQMIAQNFPQTLN